MPIVSRTARRLGLVDEPGERKIHKNPVPRFGGVAIWLAFMAAFGVLTLMFWDYPHGNGIAGILTGGTMIFLLGVLDDRFNISPYIKLVWQILAALAAFYLGVEITVLDLPESKLLVLNSLSLPVTLLWLVGISNAMNFIDGVDGLAGGVAVISAITLAVVAVFTNQPVAAVMAALLAGASLGFLVYNFYPARIFMGDSGSLFCGFVLASIAVTGVLKTQVAVMLVPMVILTVPIFDVVFSTLRRVFKGKNPFIADAEHIHHRLLHAGFSQVRIVGMLYAACVIAGMVATGYVQYLGVYMALILGLCVLTLALLMLRFSSNAEEFRQLETAERESSRANGVAEDEKSPSGASASQKSGLMP